MPSIGRIAVGAVLLGALLAAGCTPGASTETAKGPGTGRPTMYEFSTDT